MQSLHITSRQQKVVHCCHSDRLKPLFRMAILSFKTIQSTLSRFAHLWLSQHFMKHWRTSSVVLMGRWIKCLLEYIDKQEAVSSILNMWLCGDELSHTYSCDYVRFHRCVYSKPKQCCSEIKSTSLEFFHDLLRQQPSVASQNINFDVNNVKSILAAFVKLCSPCVGCGMHDANKFSSYLYKHTHIHYNHLSLTSVLACTSRYIHTVI